MDDAGRDYVVEMRALIEQEAQGEYWSNQVAEHIVEKLRVNDPELLTGWLEAQAITLLTQTINSRDRSLRAVARVNKSRSVFAVDASSAEKGQKEHLVSWLTVPYALEDNARKPLALLTASDLRYVADRYQERAKHNKFEAIFFEMLAKKVGSKTVGEVFSDEQIVRLREQINF
jgi:hypothetical protein